MLLISNHPRIVTAKEVVSNNDYFVVNYNSITKKVKIPVKFCPAGSVTQIADTVLAAESFEELKELAVANGISEDQLKNPLA